ncbi:MAG TPA: adenosylcobinamide-phosphate synthase CbiB [Devosia sp.]|jgi:adenosylcobinamide-phosphate synthase|nr:adenosylcobinamide-phosphate synthase CbiB [Devosia sp.]
MAWLLAPLALLIERLAGYPHWLFKAIGHPVTWIGALISWLEVQLNRGERRRLKGVLALLFVLLAVLAVGLAITAVTRTVPFGWVLEAVLASTLLAQKELGRAVAAVAAGLGVSLAAGQRAVSQVVGRDTAVLDEAGVSRAAVETLAESTSDGVVAPLFWLLLGGLPGVLVYKAVNTADSMIGHKNERFHAFGWASARLDDALNWIPARLTALLVAAAAFLVRRADPEAAWSTALRDARKHDSPNAGWPEAAFAGALGFQLGGARMYEGEMHELPSFGDGRSELSPLDILKSLELYWMAMNLLLATVLALALVLWRFA